MKKITRLDDMMERINKVRAMKSPEAACKKIGGSSASGKSESMEEKDETTPCLSPGGANSRIPRKPSKKSIKRKQALTECQAVDEHVSYDDGFGSGFNISDLNLDDIDDINGLDDIDGFDHRLFEEYEKTKKKPSRSQRKKNVFAKVGKLDNNVSVKFEADESAMKIVSQLKSEINECEPCDKIYPNDIPAEKEKTIEIVSQPSKIPTEPKIVHAEKIVPNSVMFQSGDEKNKNLLIQGEKAVRNKVIKNSAKQIGKYTSFSLHQSLANKLQQMSEDNLFELFLYIDDCGGREFVNGLLALLEDRECSLMNKKPKKANNVSDLDEFGEFDDFEEEDGDLQPCIGLPKAPPEQDVIQFSFQQQPAGDGSKEPPKIFKRNPRSPF